MNASNKMLLKAIFLKVLIEDSQYTNPSEPMQKAITESTTMQRSSEKIDKGSPFQLVYPTDELRP